MFSFTKALAWYLAHDGHSTGIPPESSGLALCGLGILQWQWAAFFTWQIAFQPGAFDTTVILRVQEAPHSPVRSPGLTYTQLLAFFSWPLCPSLPLVRQIYPL